MSKPNNIKARTVPIANFMWNSFVILTFHNYMLRERNNNAAMSIVIGR